MTAAARAAGARLVVAAAGLGATIQDEGRFGFLRFGVTPAGPMDRAAFLTANRALGNAPGAAAVEIGPGGLSVVAGVPVVLAYAGGRFRWSRDDQALPPAARVTLRPGELLCARAGADGAWSYLAVPGGIDVPLVMGSRATHLRAGLGGLEGRALATGDVLPFAGDPANGLDDAEIEARWLHPDPAPIRVVLGPQDDHFTADALALFLRAEWRVAAAADRMSYALEGPALARRRPQDIVSDGVALGAVQVAGSGKPLVLMADRQPTGGYPKIAHVIRADIGRAAQLRAGAACRFAAVSVEEAREALLLLEGEIGRVASTMRPLRLTPGAGRLMGANLIGGVTDGGAQPQPMK